MNVIRSYKHEVYTEEVNKVALCSDDDKRYILEDGINTLAWGHYKIPQNVQEQVKQSIVKNPGDLCSCTIFNDPIELKQCDVINFISRTANSRITNAYVSILIELDL